MPFVDPPPTAAWQHQEARLGFEVVWFHPLDDGYRIEGCTTAIERSRAWVVDYAIELDATWTTLSARVCGRSTSGSRSVAIDGDGAGHWRVDGRAAPHLDGCLDVDLESSALTNALPVHRLGLPVGGRAAAAAVYVRAPDLAVGRLDQTYLRVADESSRQRYEYEAPAFEFACRLTYDEAGLVLDYPGIALRVG